MPTFPYETAFSGQNKQTVRKTAKVYRNKVVAILILQNFVFQAKPCKINNNVTVQQYMSKNTLTNQTKGVYDELV